MIDEIATDKMIDMASIGKNIEKTITDPIMNQIMERNS